MLYETLIQPKLLFIFVFLGIFCGFLFDFSKIIKYFFANKKTPSKIITLLTTLFSLFLLFFHNLKFNYGSIRLFPFFVFLVSLIAYHWIKKGLIHFIKLFQK